MWAGGRVCARSNRVGIRAATRTEGRPVQASRATTRTTSVAAYMTHMSHNADHPSPPLTQLMPNDGSVTAVTWYHARKGWKGRRAPITVRRGAAPSSVAQDQCSSKSNASDTILPIVVSIVALFEAVLLHVFLHVKHVLLAVYQKRT